MAWKIKTGDEVFVIAGDHKGLKGKILKVDRQKLRVTVESVNLRLRRLKPSVANPEGGTERKECSIHASNVALANPDAEKSLEWKASMITRVGFRVNADGKKVRYAKRNGKEIS